MSAVLEKSSPVPADAAGAPDTSRQLTPAQHEAIAEELRVRAQQREDARGLDPETGALYWEAGHELIAASAPADRIRGHIRMLRISSSLAKAVEASAVPPYRAPQRDDEGNLIDRTENVRRISGEILVDAGKLLMEEDGDVALVFDGESEPVKPSEVFVEASIEAAKDTFSKESVIVQGVGRVNDEVIEEVGARGEAAVLDLTTKLGEQPGVQAARFIAEAADLTAAHLEAAHEVPRAPLAA